MRRLLLFLLAAMAFVACTQNEVEELTANRADIPETLTVGFEGGDTRIELNEALKTVWTEGDEVSVYFYSDANQKWQYQGETGDRSGELKRVSGEVGEQLMDNTIVVYPYNESYKINLSEGGVKASLPAVQSYKDGSYGKEGNIMVAAGEFTQFSLKSVVGWLRVELTGEGEVVESITVRGNGDEQLAGLCYIDAEDASVTLASNKATTEEDGEVSGNLNFDGSMLTEVMLDCGDGVELGAEATEFYIALLPQTFEKGMTVEVGYANGNSQTLVYENVITISRNHISPIGIEASEEEDVVNSQIFYTATELVEPYKASAFNVAIVSNEWDEATGEGIITFYGELTTIGEYAFINCDSLTSVTIPDSVTTIGDNAFDICDRLTSVTIGDSVTTIGDYAFWGCDDLTSVTIGDSVTTIGDQAFFSCSSLTSVTIPDSITTIGEYAFAGCSSLTGVTIPYSVTEMGIGAFAMCDNLKKFNGKFAEDEGRCLIVDGVLNSFAIGCSVAEYTIPDSVTTIGPQAFYECNNLTSVAFGNGVTTIGPQAFYECNNLTSVAFGNGVTAIGYAAFYNCESLTSVTIPDSVTTIGDQAFSYCFSLTSVTIGDSVTTIGDSAFHVCSSLTSVTIPDSVTTIGEGVFSECRSLTSVYCKATTPPTLGGSMFYSSVTIYIPEGSLRAYKLAENWSKYADCFVEYDYNSTMTLSYTTSDGMPVDARAPIVSNSYQNGVGELTYIGKDIIPAYLFRNCDNLISATIPDSVTTIGDYAFAFCDSLTSVTIGDSVTTIGYEAFYNCNSLTSVYCKATTPPTLGDGVFKYFNTAKWEHVNIGCPIYVPEGSLRAYKMAEYWSDYADCFVEYDYNSTVTISYTTSDGMPVDAHAPIVSNSYQNGVGELKYFGKDIIPAYLFRNCDNLTSVTIPDNVTTIGGSAFRDCDSLTSVTIPDSVTTIGEYAFWACHSLTSVTIPDSVTTIGNYAFGYCDSLTSVTIGNSVTTIGVYAFYECESLTSVTIPDSVTTIGNYAFYSCDSLTSVTIGDSVTTIGEYAFYNCSSLTSVYITDVAAWCNISFGDSFSNPLWYAKALYLNNELVKELTIPDSVTTIGDEAFHNCSSLTTVTIPDSVTTIGNWAFDSCSSLRSVTIPDSVTTIGNRAFFSCSSLTSVTIGDSVTTIGDEAFSGCTSLTSVYCKATTPPSLGYNAFKYYYYYGYVNIGCPIYVPAESVEAYKAAENWSEYAADIVGYDFE